MPVCLLEPVWHQFEAMLPRHTVVAPSHPLGCQRRRVSDRVVFAHVLAALVHGSGYERIATPGCSDPTIRRRVHAWAEAGLAEALHTLVLTHHPRPSIEMEGGIVFHSVDASSREALDLAREAAGDLDVRIGGGPATVRDFIAADRIDVLHVVQVPILLGRGARLWDGLEGIEERFDIDVVSSPSDVAHVTFKRR